MKNRNPDDIPDEEFIAFFKQYANYYPTLSIIERWRRFFPLHHVHIGFYDDLCQSPLGFYREICGFIGIDEQHTTEEGREKLSARVNEGRPLPMPIRFAEYLAGIWDKELELLCTAFAPHPEKWRQRCSEIREGTSS